MIAKFIRSLAGVVLAAVLAGWPAIAAAEADPGEGVRPCLQGTDDDAVIAGCTLALTAGMGGTDDVPFYKARGRAYGRKAQYDRALADFNQVIRVDPHNSEAWIGRCWLRVVARQTPLALSDCNEAVRASRDDDIARFARGIANLKTGRNDAALADFEALIHRDSTNAGALYGRGLARQRKGNAAGRADIDAAKAQGGSLVDELEHLYGMSEIAGAPPQTSTPPGDASPKRTGGAAERIGDVTVSINGTFPSHVIAQNARAPGTPSTYQVKARIELRAQRLVYSADDGRFEMRFDGSPTTSTAPARCNDKPTATPRRSTARAWLADGKVMVVRASDAAFAAGGPCGGTTDSLNETFLITIANNGTCNFGHTIVRKRGGANPTGRTVTVVDQPCEVVLPVP